MLRLFLIFSPGIWLLDLIKIKELLQFDIIINVAQMQLKQVVALVKNSIFNRHNCTYWSQYNPHVILEKEVNVPRITVWAAMSSNGIIGPFFFNASVTGKRYLNMLQTYFFPQVQQQEYIYFQQDGAHKIYLNLQLLLI